MSSKVKIIIPALVIVLLGAGVLIFILTRTDQKPEPKKAVASCSLLSPTEATKLLGSGTYLQQAKTAKVQYLNVTACQYDSKNSSKSIVIGQRAALTSYGQQSLKKNFFSNPSPGEAAIKFASYAGFTYPKQPGNIRIWFKNTWLSVFSPSQKISEAVLTDFVKTH